MIKYYNQLESEDTTELLVAKTTNSEFLKKNFTRRRALRPSKRKFKPTYVCKGIETVDQEYLIAVNIR